MLSSGYRSNAITHVIACTSTCANDQLYCNSYISLKYTIIVLIIIGTHAVEDYMYKKGISINNTKYTKGYPILKSSG